jgi:hypothetical protein
VHRGKRNSANGADLAGVLGHRSGAVQGARSRYGWGSYAKTVVVSSSGAR